LLSVHPSGRWLVGAVGIEIASLLHKDLHGRFSPFEPASAASAKLS
jgi:hypothetical protein